MHRFVAILFPLAVTSVALATGSLAAQETPGGPGSLPNRPAALTPSVPAAPIEKRTTSARDAGNAVGVRVPVAATHPYFDRFVSTGLVDYGVANHDGVYVSEDGGASWVRRDVGLPHRIVYPFDNGDIETITGLGVDPLDSRRAAVTTSLGLWVSNDAGQTWKAIPLVSPVNSVAYITSVAVSPWSRSTYAVGTSFGGLFETTDGGRSWTSRSKSLQFIYRGAGFYEEISGVSYSPFERDVLYLGVGFGGGVYQSNAARSAWTSIAFPVGTSEDSPPVEKGRTEVIRQLSAGISNEEPVLTVSTERHTWQYSLVERDWRITGEALPPPSIDPAKAQRIAVAANRSGLYLAATDASGAGLQKMVRLARANGLNAFVVDAKDDFGRLTYDSHVPLARAIGAVHPFFNLQELIKVAHENGIYVVARMVVFKDEKLYAYDDHKYSVWDSRTKGPWGNRIREVDPKSGEVSYVQREFWVDPFSEDAWHYNVAIARELQDRGVDEVQFDYIRFPSDGPLDEAQYRFKREGMTRIDALESYMIMARQALRIPISTDLYGFNSWYRMGNWIGQNIEMLAQYVDVVCPMFYPSHFPVTFMEKIPYLERAKLIYVYGTRRAKEIVRGRADIRPFMQAFLLQPNELAMDQQAYSHYLRIQLEGALEARSSGFTLWNAASDYYMITFPLTSYVAKRE